MDDNLKLTLITMLILFIALLFQSTVLNAIAIIGAKPDIALMVIIFLGFRKGRIAGQISGFFTGLFEDFISLTPPGFNSLVKMTIGYIFGLLRGGFLIDALVVPAIFLFAGTIIKGIISWLLVIVFSLPHHGTSIFSLKFLVELLYNCILAPVVFGLLRLIKIFRVAEKEKVS